MNDPRAKVALSNAAAGRDYMAGFQLVLPTIQNWNCHSCGGCCKRHLVEISEEERQRILAQGWAESDGISDDQPILVKDIGPIWNRRYRLGQREDGSCVFLDERGLCKMHAKFGEASKPLACRVYPYAFHPSGKQVTVSLRFSCPSVVENRGQAVSDQAQPLKAMAREVVPETVTSLPAPALHSNQYLDWPDFLQVVDALETTFRDRDTPVAIKLMRALFWTGLVRQSRFDIVRGGRLDGFLSMIRAAADSEVGTDVNQIDPPSRAGRLQFRMLAAQYARNDTLSNAQSGLRGRWRLLTAAVRFARGTGQVPPLQEVFAPIAFETLERPFGGLNPAMEEMFTRYFRVKIKGLQFCGRAYFGIPLVEGFQALALVYPSMLWLARWLAAGRGREALTTEDVSDAIALADHYHGYTPQFGQRNFRRRVRLLAQSDDIGRLCAWYSR